MKKLILLIGFLCLILTGCTASNKESLSNLILESSDSKLIYSNRYSLNYSSDYENEGIESVLKKYIFNEERTVSLNTNEIQFRKDCTDAGFNENEIEQYMDDWSAELENLKSYFAELVLNLNEEVSGNIEYSESSVLLTLKISDSNYLKIYGTGYAGICYNDRMVFYSLSADQINEVIKLFIEFIQNQSCNNYGCIDEIIDYYNDFN